MNPRGACPPSGELELAAETDALTPQARAHLEGCAQCRRRYEDVRANAEFLADAGDTLRELAQRPPEPEERPDVVPGYALVREIARGGQGVVYEGVQTETRRRVAIKMIYAGRGASSRRRLEREAEIAAGLKHPHIVTIYESRPVGADRYAIAMEFIEGSTLAEWGGEIDAHCPGTREARRDALRRKVRSFADVCDAVQHAHLQGVIHRDLKPANVLVDREGVARVVDFGIARRTAGEATLTRTGAFAGTLSYASPEQVSTRAEAVDSRSDVYSLGLMLYELLAGGPPYDTGGSLTGAITNIVTSPPRPLRAVLPGGQPADADLQAIVAMALAKSPAERYQTAGALRDDLLAWLGSRPVQARQHSALYVIRSIARRHRLAFNLVAASLVLLAGIATFMGWSAKRLATERARLATALSSSHIERARLLAKSGARSRAEGLILEEIALNFPLRQPPHDLLFDSPELLTQGSWALAELYAAQFCRLRTDIRASPMALEVSGTHARILLSDDEGRLSRRTYSLLDESIEEEPRPDLGRILPQSVLDRSGQSIIQDGESGLVLLTMPGCEPVRLGHFAEAIAWADADPLGSVVVVQDTSNRVRLIRSDTQPREIELLPAAPERTITRLNSTRTCAAAIRGPTLLAWRLADAQLLGTWTIPATLWAESVRPTVYTAVPSPDATRVATSCGTTLLVFDATRPGTDPIITAPHSGFISVLKFSDDGRTLVGTSSDSMLFVLDLRTGAIRQTMERLGAYAAMTAVSPDGSVVATCSPEGLLEVWNASTSAWLTRVPAADNSIHSVRVVPQRDCVVSVAADGAVRAQPVSNPRAQLWRADVPATPQTALAVSRDGRFVAATGYEGDVREWSADDGASRGVVGKLADFSTSLDYSPDNSSIACATGRGDIFVLPRQGGSPPRSFHAHEGRVVKVAYSPDGLTLASVGADSLAALWDARTLQRRATLSGHQRQVRAMAFSADGATLATGSDDCSIRLWDVATGRCVRVIPGVLQHCFSLVWHPAGNLLFSACRSPHIQVWDTRSGREIARLSGHEDMVLSLSMSGDGSKLVSSSVDRTIGVWDLAHYQPHILRALHQRATSPPASP